MKKRVSFFAVFLAVLTMLVPNVNAADVHDKITISQGINLGKVKFENYDDTNDVNNYTITIEANETLIQMVLNQHPGNPSSQANLGSYYIGYYLDGGASQYIKQSVSYTDGDVAAAKTKLNALLEKEEPSTNNQFWPYYIRVQYYDSEAKAWKYVTDKGNGSVTIGANLARLVGKNEADLVYGTDYRFYMNDGLSLLIGWRYTNTEGETVTQYVNVTYDVHFPISGKKGNEEVYFPTLEDAMASEFTDITIKEDITFADDLELKGANKTITIAKDVTVKVANDKTLTNEANIKNYGTIEASIVNNEQLYNYGEIRGEVTSEGYLQNSGTLKGNVTNTGDLYNDSKAKIEGNVITDGAITNQGEITGNITNSKGNKLYHIVLPEGTEFGALYTFNSMFAVGDVVSLHTALEEGYEVKNLKVVYVKDGKETAVKVNEIKDKSGYTHYEFEMPAGDVKVTAEISKIKNPETYDGILGYVATGAASVLGLIALVFATKFSKKTN